MSRLDEEKFEVELEQTILKIKWDLMSKEDKDKKKTKSDRAIELILDDEQIEECEEYEELLEAKSRMVYDCEENKIDFSRRRTTDLKNNARVIFPRSRNFQTEAKFELLRLEAMGVFEGYKNEKCDKYGRQNSNLSKSEERGLKSLLKRTKEGELVVLPTDKTGQFAVMDRDGYEQAGLEHVKEDTEVGWDELKVAQKELNGHVSMMIKIFRIGDRWGHNARVRETMMGESLESFPVHLLYKDHKGWSQAKGRVPPTRSVAGGNRGINLHMSEIVSDILEPMVGRVVGGCEVISTEDALANLEDISSSMKGWTSSSWWDGLKDGAYEACGKCSSMKEYEWSKEDPAWCRCADVCIELLDEIIGVVCERLREVQTLPKGDITKEVDRSDEADPEVGGGGRVVVRKCTYDYMRTLRRLRWEEEMDWDIEDEGRVVDSTEVLPEDLQDYTVPMVIIGSDVVSLYPNLDVDLVVDRIRDEVLRTDLRFMNVDYLEATRYLVLNWSEEECRMSSLRRVLPHRRGRRGTRPGMRGAGPRGKQRGDQEQWEFRNDIILEEGEKKQILAEVIKLAVLAMLVVYLDIL